MDDSGRGTAPVSSTDGSGYIPKYNDAGRSTASGLYSAAEPLFGSRSRGSLIDDEDLKDDNETFLFQQQHMPRSHSAAPLLRESKSLGPPPGYAMNGMNPNIQMNVGMQRSSSTGVIGAQQKSSSSVLHSLGLDSDGSELGAVKPAPKTLMDLIQEDFPTSPSPVYNEEQDGSYRSEYSSHSRPRTASPPSQYNRADNRSYEFEQQQQQQRVARMEDGRYGMEQHERVTYSQRDTVGDMTHSMDRMRINTRDGYAVSNVAYLFLAVVSNDALFLI